MRKPPRVTTRYKRDNADDDEDDGAAVAMLATTLTMGKSLVCMIFDLPDEETTPEDVIEDKKLDREGIIAKLRALNLNVDQLVRRCSSLPPCALSSPPCPPPPTWSCMWTPPPWCQLGWCCQLLIASSQLDTAPPTLTLR